MRKICIALTVALAGCAIQEVASPVAPGRQITEVCIQENQAVIVGDFLPTLKQAVERNGIKAKVYAQVPASCSTVIRYVAYQRWDFTSFLSEADIKLYQDDEVIGTAFYQTPKGLFGSGGANPRKFATTAEKIDPLVDEMLKNYRVATAVSRAN